MRAAEWLRSNRGIPNTSAGYPPEVRAGIARVCGPQAHAEHYFATFFDNAYDGWSMSQQASGLICRGDWQPEPPLKDQWGLAKSAGTLSRILGGK
jgi:hypothetical protein